MMLTERRADVLTEVMNMGMGLAANTLNQLVGTHIDWRVPAVAIETAHEARKRIRELGRVPLSTVQLNFDGPLEGMAALLFPPESAAKLVALLTDGGEGDGVRRTTLEEAGNILLNGVVGSFSNLVEERIHLSLPYYSESGPAIEDLAAMPGGAGEESRGVILAGAHFEVPTHRIEGEILLCLAVQPLEGLLAALDQQTAAAYSG